MARETDMLERTTSAPVRPGPRRRRARATLAVAFVAALAVVGGACAPPSPPAGGGGVDIELGPLTVPLPPIELRAPATNIPLGLCSIAYQPPGVLIRGATVTIPRVRIDPAQPIITVPNLSVKIPQLRIPLSTVTLRCGLLVIPTQVDLIIPSTVFVKAATLNLTARTITLTNPSFTLNGAGLGLLGLDLVVPLPPILNVPLPTTAIAF